MTLPCSQQMLKIIHRKHTHTHQFPVAIFVCIIITEDFHNFPCCLCGMPLLVALDKVFFFYLPHQPKGMLIARELCKWHSVLKNAQNLA